VIRVIRGPEPGVLASARTKGIEQAVAAYNEAGAPSEKLSSALKGYDGMGVKLALFLGQRKKCAYCERRRDFSSSPVEHYRPKAGALRHRRGQTAKESKGHYWWLTWSWENLLFACPRCNDQGHKGNYFPLEEGSTEAEVLLRPATVEGAGTIELSIERPMLLDPSADSFLDHVRWEPLGTHLARSLWSWSPRGITERGRATIEILKLDELADDLQHHLTEQVLPKLEEVEQHLRGRRSQQAAASWQGVLRLLEPHHDFTAATWCALERWTPPQWLAERGLELLSRPL
jgi:hypothetical protein